MRKGIGYNHEEGEGRRGMARHGYTPFAEGNASPADNRVPEIDCWVVVVAVEVVMVVVPLVGDYYLCLRMEMNDDLVDLVCFDGLRNEKTFLKKKKTQILSPSGFSLNRVN